MVDARSGVGGFGCWIVIDHVIGGQKVSTVYGHMFPAGLHVSKGQRVTRGQYIADIGNNGDVVAGAGGDGSHLHFEVWPLGRLTGGAAVDPAPWLI